VRQLLIVGTVIIRYNPEGVGAHLPTRNPLSKETKLRLTMTLWEVTICSITLLSALCYLNYFSDYSFDFFLLCYDMLACCMLLLCLLLQDGRFGSIHQQSRYFLLKCLLPDSKVSEHDFVCYGYQFLPFQRFWYFILEFFWQCGILLFLFYYSLLNIRNVYDKANCN
jgi:hypothetical protein